MIRQLGLELLGIKFANPFLLASTPPTRAHKWPRIAQAGWAGGVTWAGECLVPIVSTPGQKSFLLRLRLQTAGNHIEETEWSCQSGAAFPAGLDMHQGIFSPQLLGERVRQAKKSGLPVGANIRLGTEVQPWVQSAKIAEVAGADFLELNLSCPTSPWGLYFCRDLQIVAEITKSVRSATRLPIVAKLHACLLPEELKELAVTVVDAGADAISTTNHFKGLVGIDIEAGVPWACDVDNEGKLRAFPAAFTGPSIKPFGLRAVAEIASVVDVPIMGIGGITDWQSAVEYMMAGASVVQVGMAAMLFGYGMVRDMTKGLEGFMERKGYERPEDFVGLCRRNTVGFGKDAVPLGYEPPRRMVVDEEKCDGCGRCVAGCLATADGAIKLRKKVAQINDSLCIRCNVCQLVCSNRAIYSVKS